MTTPAPGEATAPSAAGGEHRWSGWPGAWCLRCGAEDMTEICALTHEHAVLDPERGICIVPCAVQQPPCPITDAQAGGHLSAEDQP